MNFLFFDIESNGLPADRKASYTDVDKWPRVTELAWLLTNEEGAVLGESRFLIKPDGWEIPKTEFFVQSGMSTERNEQYGVPVLEAIEPFMGAKFVADVLVGHNLSFDHRTLWAEIIRLGMQPRSGMPKVCTMLKSIKFCGLRQANGKGAKFPSLGDLYLACFGQQLEMAHNALHDIRATMECFFELVRLNIITPEDFIPKEKRA